MDDLRHCKTRLISIRFFKNQISGFDPNFYFTAYDSLTTHARGQADGARWRVLFNIESMSDPYMFRTMTSGANKHNNTKI